MILTADVGNTETTLGVFDDAGDTPGQPRAHWRLATIASRTADEIAVLLAALMLRQGLQAYQVSGVAIASVVPGVTDVLAQACRSLFEVEPAVVDGMTPLPIRLSVDEPLAVGADRIVNTLAVHLLYRQDAIVVDLGTATTFDCITGEGEFLGGVISPGVQSGAETLVRRTAKLPATELAPPKRAIGRNTEECIRAGVIFGAADGIDGIVRRIKAEWPREADPLVLATGGMAPVLARLCQSIDRVEPWLTLQGLWLASRAIGAASGAWPARR